MRRRLNLKLLVVLLVLVPILGLGIHFLHDAQVRRNAGAFLEQANRAEEAGDFDGTVDQLRRYIALAPADADTLARLGLLLDRRATNARSRLEAFFVLEQALRLDPQRHAVRRESVRIAMSVHRYTDARDHLEMLLRTSPDDAELEDLQGQCAAANAQFAVAAEAWQRALKHQPQRVDCATRLAWLLRQRLDRPKDADLVMEHLVAANPQSAKAHLARGKYLWRFDSPDKGATEIEHVLTNLAPDDADVLLAAAELAMTRQQRDQARSHLEHALKLHPNDARLGHALARLELHAGRRGHAVELVRASLDAIGDKPEVLWSAADLFLEAGEIEQARAVLARLEVVGAPVGTVDYLKGRLAAADENWVEARRLLESARQHLNGTPELLKHANFQLALCYRHLGNPDQERAAYRSSADADPSWTPARLALAEAMAAQGRPDEALALYAKLMPQQPELRVPVGRLMLARLLRLPADQRKW